MKPTGLEKLEPVDADVINELCEIVDIAVVKRLEKGSDQKFYIETSQGERRLLGVYKNEPEWLEGGDYRVPNHIASGGIRCSLFIENGVFRDETMKYILLVMKL